MVKVTGRYPDFIYRTSSKGDKRLGSKEILVNEETKLGVLSVDLEPPFHYPSRQFSGLQPLAL